MRANTYRHTFSSRCPVDGECIAYSLTICATHRILAEDIVTACGGFREALHEDIADALHDQLGGTQTLRARHGHVEIETVRG